MSVNMGYCRFRNTLEALRECYDDVPDWFGSMGGEELSQEEKSAALKLLRLCALIADDYSGVLES